MQPFYSASVGQEWQFLLASLDMYSRSHQHEAALLRVLLRQLLVNLSADIPDVLAWRSGHTNLGAKRASEYRNDSFTKLRVLSSQTSQGWMQMYQMFPVSPRFFPAGHMEQAMFLLEASLRILLACQLNSVSCRDMREQ